MKKSNKTIFAVTCNLLPELRNLKFFKSRDGARKYLKSLADEKRYKLGIDCWQESEDKISYIFGWEETKITYAIVEVPIEN